MLIDSKVVSVYVSLSHGKHFFFISNLLFVACANDSTRTGSKIVMNPSGRW